MHEIQCKQLCASCAIFRCKYHWGGRNNIVCRRRGRRFSVCLCGCVGDNNSAVPVVCSLHKKLISFSFFALSAPNNITKIDLAPKVNFPFGSQFRRLYSIFFLFRGNNMQSNVSLSTHLTPSLYVWTRSASKEHISVNKLAVGVCMLTSSKRRKNREKIWKCFLRLRWPTDELCGMTRHVYVWLTKACEEKARRFHSTGRAKEKGRHKVCVCACVRKRVICAAALTRTNRQTIVNFLFIFILYFTRASQPHNCSVGAHSIIQ